MRKNILTGIAFLTMLLALTACNQQTQPDLPNPTTIPTATFTPVPTAITLTVTPTSEPVHTPTSTPSPEPTNTTTPTPSPTPEPTSTPTPTPSPTLEPTSTPTPTPSPSPGPTSTPTPTPSPSPEPTNTPTPTPTKAPVVSSGLPEIIYKEDTIIDDTMLTSEEEVNRYIFQMALDNYYLFGILAKDISMFHSEEEYLELFPEFIDIEFDTLTKYHNGYYLTVKNLKTTQTDLAYRYALRTGDTSFLTENETKAYHKLFDIANKLNLQELSDIEAVLAVHDYLVLNTDYDQLPVPAVFPTMQRVYCSITLPSAPDTLPPSSFSCKSPALTANMFLPTVMPGIWFKSMMNGTTLMLPGMILSPKNPTPFFIPTL